MTGGEYGVGSGGVVSFEATPGGIRVTDRVAGRSVVVGVDEGPSLSASDPGSFVAPLDDAVTCYARELRLEGVGNVAVLDADGEHVGTVTPEAGERRRGTHYFAVSAVPMLYIRAFDSAFTLESADAPGSGIDVRVSFEGRTRVEVGARSLHERPAATITTTADPAAVTTAISYLGAGMKEWTPERSWPTVRGHPPRIELGDELSVPDGLERPSPRVTLTVPPRLPEIFRVAPLATYLGAAVEPGHGDTADLHLANGYTEALGAGRELERRVDDLLARCFFLDSLVRIGGYYDFDRYEYTEVAPALPFYPPELYDASLSEQLMEYLEVPAETIEPYRPNWPLTATLRDVAGDVELLPFLARDFARVRVRGTGEEPPSMGEEPLSVTGVGRATGFSGRPPAGGVHLSAAGFENALDATPGSRGETAFVLFGADAAVEPFEAVAGSHGDPDDPPDVRSERATVAAATEALGTSSACVVLGGHATGSRVECADGVLSVGDVDVRATTVLLADAEEVDPAAALVDGGAVNALAVAGDEPGVGRAAGYLSAGFTFGDAVALADLDAVWREAGDPLAESVAVADGSHVYVDATSRSETEHELARTHLLGGQSRLGAVSRVEEPATLQLTGATVTDPFPVDTAHVVELAHDPDIALTLNGERVHDGLAVTAEGVRASAQRALDAGSGSARSSE